MRYPLPRRATLPRLPAVLQTHRSRWTLSALRRTRRTCRSHYLTRRSCRFSYPQACAFPQRRGSPAPPPQESYYGGVSLPTTEIILTGGPYLSIEVGRSPLSKPLVPCRRPDHVPCNPPGENGSKFYQADRGTTNARPTVL